METRGRRASLVMVDRRGEARGTVGPLDVAEPWWPEAGPVVDALAEIGLGNLVGPGRGTGDGPDPGPVVLRLLWAEPDPDGPMGGRVAYAVEYEGPVAPGVLAPVSGTDLALLADHPLRLPWARPGGPADDLAWVGRQVEVTGPPRQHRSWNLSSIWSIPSSTGTVWLKTVPPFLAHEATVLRVLHDQPIPDLLAAEGHRLLLGPLPGVDGYEADETEQCAMVTALVDLQVAAANRVDALLEGGVPDLRADALAEELAALVDRVAPERDPLRRLVDQLPDRLAEAARWSPPDTLVHGDPHPGNCRRGVEPPVWFDWGDAFVGNPLLDLAATHRMSPAAVDAWLGAMTRAWPGCDPLRARTVLEPVSALRQAWVYQRFLDGLEPTEHLYHEGDVTDALDAAEALLA